MEIKGGIISISIPYGAIKSIKSNVAVAFRPVISIPYGAIKRTDHFVKKNWSVRFQFLMVRLKERTISNCLQILTIFQFLMVRLKETPVIKLGLMKINFNSLWCD